MAAREPLPRTWHAAVGIGSTLYVWGGYSDSSKISARALESFDVPSLTWEHPRNLDVPDGLRGMAVTSDGERAYCCCGVTGSLMNPTCRNELFEIDLVRSTFEEVQPTSPSHTAPKETSGSRAVYFQSKVVLFGGRTDQGHINELHVFDLKKRVWETQPTTGEKPPPLYSHTFTKIDHHRAVLFGGHDGSSTFGDTYVLDMETWHWTKLTCRAEPPARYHHAACCITGPLTGQEHPLLMVVGGVVSGVGVAGDVWLLDVDNRVWSKVTLPVAITPRDGHSATMFGSGPSFRVVVLFGGEKYNDKSSYISETTLLLLELGGDSWQVTRVVKPDELGRPDESLREEMRKLELSPQEEFQTQSSVTDGAASPTSLKATSSSTHTSGAEAKPCPTIDIKDIQMVRLIARGGFGDVYKAKWKNNIVAVKVCLGNLLENLSEEVKILSALPQHSNVIMFYGVTLSGDSLSTLIITELASHGSLYNYLHVKKNEPSLDQSLIWALQVASGMQHLHNNNAVHRDLKSANIVLSLGMIAKVCDFGTARILAKTSMTSQKGTYRWMAPEIVQNVEANINKMCDVFSYGMVLYEIYDCKIPFADIDGDALAGAAVVDGRRPPIPDKLPLFLHPLLQACWRKEPNQRPQFEAIVLAIETESYE